MLLREGMLLASDCIDPIDSAHVSDPVPMLGMELAMPNPPPKKPPKTPPPPKKPETPPPPKGPGRKAKKKTDAEELDTPDFIVLDTNAFMRLLILEFATEAKFFEEASRRGVKVVLVPRQTDEIWRNLRTVFDDHKKAWKELIAAAQGADRINAALNGLGALRVNVAAATEAARALQGHGEKLTLSDHDWAAFEPEAERVLADLQAGNVNVDLRSVEADLIAKAEERAKWKNPPCTSDKNYHLFDCLVWETVLHLLRGGSTVWFATADTDYGKGGQLNTLLNRETLHARDRFRFYFEAHDRAKNPGNRFRIADALLSSKPEAAAALSVIAMVSPSEPDHEDNDDNWDDYEYDDDGGHLGLCFCGEDVPIASMTCAACGMTNDGMVGSTEYIIEPVAPMGCRVRSVSVDALAEEQADLVTCEGCQGDVFEVDFESFCDYHSNRFSKDD